MTITINATDVELPLEVNNIYSHTFLDRAIGHLPYLTGSTAGKIEKGKDSRTMKWARHGEIGEDVTPLGELTGDSIYGQGRNSTSVSRTTITATLAKYGRFLTFNEEVNIFEGSAVINDITGALGEGCGKSLNGLQRNILEDNITLRFASGAANDAAVVAKITFSDIAVVVQQLINNEAKAFMPISKGSQIVGSTPVLSSFLGHVHPDVAFDISQISGFKSVETYVGHTEILPGEFGMISVSGFGVRFCQSTSATKDAGAGGAVGAGIMRDGSNDADLYTVVIQGKDAHGTVGLGKNLPDGNISTKNYGAEEKVNFDFAEMILHDIGSGGMSDPFNEVGGVAYKFWHAGQIMDGRWARGIRSAASNVSEI